MDPAQEVSEMIAKLQGKVEELTRIVNSTLAKVPDVLSWVVDRLIEGWNTLMAKLGEFWDWFTDKLSYVGDPFGLNAAAVSWREDVGGVVANLVRDIDDSDLLVDDRWQGDGADQYRQAVDPQREALGSISTDFASNISSALSALALAIASFWGAVLLAIVSVIAGFVFATGAAATVFGLPIAPPAALAGLAGGLASLAVGMSILYATAGTVRGTLAGAASGVQTWPQFVTA
ncbi:hypothetical protein [Leifsonia sp. Leaf264]|uniref:hypothetical protein n=1 Tax=Leifsonia sp. Leaf264 TaxID=1736314 RepID=UPI0006F5AD75|nr:hypothetical protein [Leifsonia sp. Leaf264]KQO96884.1 hypothetical protein ASF30_17590 [Leifsonia sp. Leaf264]